MSRRITVQICTFNRAPLAARCLEALARVDFPADDFEIVLVDDGSSDGTGEVVKSIATRGRLRYLRQDHAGLASARNTGIRAAEGEVVLFIDDDTIPDPALLSEHWKTHERHPGSVVLGWVNHVDGDRPPSARRFALADFSTSFFWTSNASVGRSDLMAAGLFDEEFTEYGWEDLELGERLRARGLTRRRNYRAVVSHVKPRWRAEDLPGLLRRAEASGRSAVIYVRKRRSLHARLATGVTPWRIWLNEPLRLGEGWCRRRIERAADGRLGPLNRLAVHLMIRTHYFRSVKAAIKASSIG